MSEFVSINSSKQSFSFAKNIQISHLIISLIVISIPLFFTIKNNFELYLFLALISIPIIYFISLNKKIWIYSVFLISAYFMRDSSAGVSTYDVLSGIFYLGGLAIWFINKIYIRREQIVYSFTDWLIIAFFILIIPNLFIALINGVKLIDWLREYGLFVLILYYFPVRDIITEKRDLVILLFIMIIVTVILNLAQFYQYYSLLQKEFLYVYQLATSIRFNQSLYTTAIIFAIAFSALQKKFIHRYLLLIFAVMTVVALIASFSRAYWVMVLVNLFIVFFFIPKYARKFIIIATIIGASLFTIFTYIVFKDKVEFFFYVLEKRFVSTAAGVKDISIQMRLNEFDGVLEQIEKYPFGGSGLARKFSYYDPIGITTQRTNFVHNGYLSLIYRVGYPLAIVFFIYLLLIFIKSFYYVFKTRDVFYKTIAICSATSIMMMIITNLLTTTISLREGSLLMGLIIGFIAIIEKKHRNNEL